RLSSGLDAAPPGITPGLSREHTFSLLLRLERQQRWQPRRRRDAQTNPDRDANHLSRETIAGDERPHRPGDESDRDERPERDALLHGQRHRLELVIAAP